MTKLIEMTFELQNMGQVIIRSKLSHIETRGKSALSGGFLWAMVLYKLWNSLHPQLWNRGGFYQHDKLQLQPTVM